MGWLGSFFTDTQNKRDPIRLNKPMGYFRSSGSSSKDAKDKYSNRIG